ncbi:protein of unassigned function [Methylobacterium oryzae CBMB20]|uniref:Protein of unassigned function n=1 Tax=Methylobacterium oryzae CBMB20 TaxID=693986 RepID=A0A089P0P5_9HYPH|nr:protein of unassigned function [Methylobacterium oryzae CBMB20]
MLKDLTDLGSGTGRAKGSLTRGRPGRFRTGGCDIALPRPEQSG